MGRTSKILRRSIFAFLQNYQFFTTTATLLAFPFAASILLLQTLIPFSSFLPILETRIQSVLDSAGFPSSTVLITKLSQTIAISVLLFPAAMSSFLLSKCSVIHALGNQEYTKTQSFSCFFELYCPLIRTQICNSIIAISAIASCVSLQFVFFNLADGFGLTFPGFSQFLSASGAVVSSIVVAYSFMVSNLALISSGVDKNGGFIAVLKAFVLIKGRIKRALLLALPITAAMAAVEALFQYRVVRAYYGEETGNFYVVFEGFFVAYLYSVLLVLDTIVGYFFFRSCQIVHCCGRRSIFHTEIQDQIPRRSLKIIVESVPDSMVQNVV